MNGRPSAPTPTAEAGLHFAFKTWVMEKTFKREIAVLALAFWSAITVKVFWFTEVNAIRSLDSAYGSVTTTIWLYAVAAFGMDWMSKQMGDPRFRQRYADTYVDPSASRRDYYPGGMGDGQGRGYYPDRDVVDRDASSRYPGPRAPVGRPTQPPRPAGETDVADPTLPPVGYADR